MRGDSQLFWSGQGEVALLRDTPTPEEPGIELGTSRLPGRPALPPELLPPPKQQTKS